MSRRRWRTAAVVGGMLVALVLGVVLRPAAGGLPEETHGDPVLAAQVRALIDGRPAAVAVGVVQDGKVRTASIGAPLSGTYEIGSISKGITGMLYVDAVARGEVEPGTTLGEVFDLGDAPAAGVTLESLSRQASGLPRLPGGIAMFVRSAVATLLGTDPYPASPDDYLAHLRTIRPDGPVPLYSNYGFAVLGHALAERAGMPYDELVGTRIAGPLGLDSLTVPASEADLGPDAVAGRDATGRPQEPWTGLAAAPAGGIRADVGDMAELARALLSGQAPGNAAVEPVAAFHDDRVGAGWITSEEDGFTWTWHNGGTGGFRSWLGMDAASGTAVVVLAATSAPVDEAGLTLLKELSG